MDWIALYGAILATILASIQISGWFERRKFLSISLCEYFVDETSYYEIIIDNRGRFPVTLDYVASGTCARGKFPFYSWSPISLVSVAKLVDREGQKTDGRLDGTVLQSGERVFGLIWRGEPQNWLGLNFDQSPKASSSNCIFIDHSQSDKPILKRLKWTD